MAFRVLPHIVESFIDLFVLVVLRLVRSKILSQGLNTCPMLLRHIGEQDAQGLEVGVVVGLLVN